MLRSLVLVPLASKQLADCCAALSGLRRSEVPSPLLAAQTRKNPEAGVLTVPPPLALVPSARQVCGAGSGRSLMLAVAARRMCHAMPTQQVSYEV